MASHLERHETMIRETERLFQSLIYSSAIGMARPVAAHMQEPSKGAVRL